MKTRQAAFMYDTAFVFLLKQNKMWGKQVFKSSVYLVPFLNMASLFNYVPFTINWDPAADKYYITPVCCLRKLLAQKRI